MQLGTRSSFGPRGLPAADDGDDVGTCCQVRDVVTTVTARITAALVCTSCALVLLPQAGPPSYYVIGLLSVLSAAVTTVSPIPQATAEFTRNFRLNESLTSAVRDGSLLVAGPLLLLLAAAAGALGVLPAAATENAAAAAWYNAVPAGGHVVDPGEPAVLGFRAVLCTLWLWLLGLKVSCQLLPSFQMCTATEPQESDQHAVQ